MASVLSSAPRSNVTSTKMASTSSSTENFTKRLQTELMTMMLSSTPSISAFPDSESDLSNWTATLSGPPDTCYANMTFKLAFEFPANYPYAPPKVQFKTPVYHPNIDMAGRICLDILKDKWSAVLNVQSVLLTIQSLLEEPNPASPLNGQAAELWENDREEYVKQVKARYQQPSGSNSV